MPKEVFLGRGVDRQLPWRGRGQATAETKFQTKVQFALLRGGPRGRNYLAEPTAVVRARTK